MQGAESVYQGANRAASFCDNVIVILTNCVCADMSGNFLESKMSETHAKTRRTTANLPFTPASRRANPASRAGAPRKSEALLAAVLNEKVTVTENGKRRQVTRREAVIAQLVNQSASAELRATKMLIDMLRDRRGSPIAWFAKGLAGQPQRGRGNCQREINSLTWYKTERPAKEEVSEGGS